VLLAAFSGRDGITSTEDTRIVERIIESGRDAEEFALEAAWSPRWRCATGPGPAIVSQSGEPDLE